MMIGHGDGLGPDDHGYKMIKKIFANKICQWLYARLHRISPSALGPYFSAPSRVARGEKDLIFSGKEHERTIRVCRGKNKRRNFLICLFSDIATFLLTENWWKIHVISILRLLVHFSYAELAGRILFLKILNNISFSIQQTKNLAFRMTIVSSKQCL